MKKHTLAEFISEEELRAKVVELGKSINEAYAGKELLIVGVLKGSFIFMADLVRELHEPKVETAFMTVSSYRGASTKSSGSVQLVCDIDRPLKDTHVLIVEDIIDSGYTINYLSDVIKVREPDSVGVCALLDKPSRRIKDFQADFIGFEIPDKFVVGYGLDYDGKYRNLKNISIVKFDGVEE
ncbi:hypoxanthine phosphoribosyltransferase [Limisalsivibrio acetivorans]|uniref:hypoxanthine phosphoribosyltransferase n=1 Tax=Limisalsivibrio acetivorans TaxID=1304888 RepID=UPI0003B3F4E8|nr:hypoxanthine phosphoribosyltransferase [Limisalsivibrio acetivorans]